MSKKIKFEILSSGEIRAKTLGIKGEECLDYVELIERLTGAETIDSEFTEEYYETTIKQSIKQQSELKRKL